ncbi:equilibrative nucleoside transporter [Plakobranchus ocellatus]|uniref:Equilibrative nucleoside transporter n=1 Tax=Plakobranchus ocellatus TaxID=259542 RepID=A0AAV4CTM7_9GAST|nr:equilibrative nucleoside transporter [Plakobranchus ocellatus]
MISGSQGSRQAREPMTGLEPVTEGSLQISGWIRYSAGIKESQSLGLNSEDVSVDETSESEIELMDYERVYKTGEHADSPERRPLIDPLVRRVPLDRRYGVFFIFGFLGLSSLLPWNFFITAKQYFDYKFRNTSIVPFDDKRNNTKLQAEFESYLSIVSQVCNLFFMVLTVLLVRSVHVKIRVVVSTLLVIALFVVVTVLVKVDTDSWQWTFFCITLTLAACMSGVQSVLTGSVLGLSAMFPPLYSQSAMIGQAAGGTFSSLMSLLTIATGGEPITSALIYFLIAIGVTIMSLILFMLLHFIDFSKFFMTLNEQPLTKVNDDDDDVLLRRESRLGFYCSIFREIWKYCFSICLVFWVTLSVFPTVCALIQSTSNETSVWTGTYFTPVVCFLLFNVGDFVGRLATFVLKFPGPNRPGLLLFLSILRIAFIPLLMLCNAQPRSHLDVILGDDAYPIILISAMGLTNGYISTLAMSFGPLSVEDRYLEGAGIMLALAMSLGLALGSSCSYLFLNML